MEFDLRDRAVHLDGTLVVADLHLGRAHATVELPVGERGDLRDRLGNLLARYEPAEVVFAGDVLHAFDTVPPAVESTFADLVAVVREAGARLVVAPGNHDARLSTVWEGPTAAEYRVGETVVCHGHEPPDATASRYVVGHDHPAITIEGRKWPCYLHGRAAYEGADVLMLPAFNRLVEGVTVNRGSGADLLSPLVTDLDRFAPVVWDPDAEEALEFPALGRFRRLL